MKPVCDPISTYQFWRPTLFALAIAAATVLICAVFFSRPLKGDISRSAAMNLQFPRPGLMPGQVVAIQLEGLQNKDDLGLGALQCYCFAAPANRVVTGPYERFARLIRSPKFQQLGDCQSFSIGKAELEGELARVLVSTVGVDRNLQVYAFVLKRVKEHPFQGCWMTVGVFPVFDQQESGTMDSQLEHVRASAPDCGPVRILFGSVRFLHPSSNEQRKRVRTIVLTSCLV